MTIRTLVDLKREIGALEEVRRLSQAVVNFTSNLKEIFTDIDFEQENAQVRSAKLLKFLKSIGASSTLMGGNLLDVNLVQYLLIHYIFSEENIEINMLGDIKPYLNKQDPKIKSIFHWKEEFKFISYQDHFELKSWNDYLVNTEADWTDLHLLDKSLPLCKVNIEQIFHYIELIVSKHQNDVMIGTLGNNLILKLRIDDKLGADAKNKINYILENDALRNFLPSFLTGIINEKTERFWEQFNSLTTARYEKYRYSIIYALGVCCPKDESCEKTFFKTLDEDEQRKLIKPSEYIQILTYKQVKTATAIDYIGNLTKISSNSAEINLSISYVINILEDCWLDENLQQIFKNVFVKDNEENVNMINELMYHILEKDILVAYSLLTLRFEAMGANSFLKEHWGVLVAKDVKLFQEYLISWFNTTNKNVHKAMIWLCTIREIESSIFKFSEEALKSLTSTDKLYIAIKVAGFIYSKEHLQSLMFSIAQATEAHEDKLLQNLHVLFHDYLIYNYRTSLETIKEIIAKKQLSSHLLEFYIKLDDAYETYFSNLSLIENYSEIRADQNLARQIQFFTQQKFSERSKEVRKSSIFNFFTETPVHSLRWAIRRDDETEHQPMPLGHFKTTIEFPSGEKLNPIYQESMRRNYQRTTKHEINID